MLPKSALKKAKLVLADDAADKSTLDRATIKLSDAQANLQSITDITASETLIKQGEGLKQD